MIFPEPQSLLTPASKMPGLDGQKMSKSYDNTISLRDTAPSIEEKIKTMPTDPARVRRTDPGDPDKCPVWGLHLVYADDDRKKWVREGCTTAGIGCLECKKPLIEAIINEQGPIRERAREYEEDPETVDGIISEGCDAARDIARETMEEVRVAMGLGHR